MKFFHLSDLHLGKRVNEFSMLEDQWDILQKIVVLAKENKPDAILIAGDVYDKSMPTVEAVQLLDRFLVWLNELGIAVFIVSGNHDNAERVAFGAELLKNSNVHIVQSYNGKMNPVTLSDGYGDINIWMLPYLKPSLVRRHFPDRDVITYSDAISAALSNANLDASARNVLIAHQFVTGAITSESEEISVGVRRMWTPRFLMGLIMLPWGIFTARSRSVEKPFDTAAPRSSIRFRKQAI